MPTVDFSRIRSNLAALNSLNALNLVNRNLATAQTRLATGKRINEAADDPAGLAIAVRFDARNEGLKTAKSLVADAKNMIATAEGSTQKVKELLVEIRSKAEIGASASTGSEQRAALEAQIDQFEEEINDIVDETTWNSTGLIDGTNSGTFTFQTGADQGEVTAVDFFSSTGLGSLSSTGLNITTSIGSLDANDSDTFNTLMGDIDTAIGSVARTLGNVGAYTARLNFKEDNLAVAQANTEAAFNRIMNADMAQEQVNATKFSVLQQTAVAMLAQANLSPQAILSLFR